VVPTFVGLGEVIDGAEERFSDGDLTPKV